MDENPWRKVPLPYVWDNLPAGKRSCYFRADENYTPEVQSVTVEAFKTNIVEFEVIPKCGALEISTTISAEYSGFCVMPTNGDVRIGEESWKRVSFPYVRTGIIQGRYPVSIRMPGFDEEVQRDYITVDAGQLKTVVFALEPEPAKLIVKSNVNGKIYDNGRLLGRVGEQLRIWPYEAHDLEIRYKALKPRKIQLPSLDPGKIYTATVQF